MVRRSELICWLNKYMKVSEIKDLLPNGLQIEGREEISRIFTAVSINRDVIEKAVDGDADAILVHHGMFWQKEEPTLVSYRKSRVKLLLENNINLLAYHLPLDYHPEISHNRLILNGISASEIIGSESLPKELDIGLEGRFAPPLHVDELLKRLEDYLRSKPGCFNYVEKSISSVFVVSGAGKTLTDKVIFYGYDAYITGDVSESIPAIAKETGLTYIYCGHYNTEKPGIIALGERIKERFDVDVEFIDIPNQI